MSIFKSHNRKLRHLVESLVYFAFFACSTAYAQQQAAVAEIVSLTGFVEVFSKRSNNWAPATPPQLLYAGDAVRTGDPGLAQILTSDGSRIHINRTSRLVLKEVANTTPWLKAAIGKVQKSIYQLFPWKTDKPAQAAFSNDTRGAHIDIETPTVKAGIRGTSMLLEVVPKAAGDKSIVSVFAGRVEVKALTGPADSLIAKPNEKIVAERGKPLQRSRLTLSPRDAVQWTLFVPPLVPSKVDTKAKLDPNYTKALIESASLLQGGQLAESKARLLDLTQRYPKYTGGYQLLAVTMLAQNEKESALDAAAKAVALDQRSPSAAIVLSYVYQAMFELDKARAETERARTLDPQYVLALINLARLQFGEDDVAGARKTLKKARALAPADAEIYNLHGFVLLARRETEAAITAFARAIALNDRLGEPHLGLGLAFMRQGETQKAFKEIAIAVLLDPHRSLFRSYWGKMLHQVKRFNKALEVLERARELDPSDPTPEYYRAIILRDLNRPGEAIAAFNNAVALNNNRAVFRSRFLLDKDLASRNVDLAILYNQLGLDAWAKNKALTSIKRDYASFDGHLFYQGVLFGREGRSYSAASEALLSRMLQPANINTFNNFNNYTSLFEKPSTQATLEGALGNADTYGVNAEVSGTLPHRNLAYSLSGGYDHEDGWRDINFKNAGNVAGIAKWQPTPHDGVLVSASWLDADQGDANFPRFEVDSPKLPDDRLESEVERLEIGYHHQFAPSSNLLLFGTYLNNRADQIQRGFCAHFPTDPLCNLPGLEVGLDSKVSSQRPFFQGQAHYAFRLATHQLYSGTLQLRGETKIDLISSCTFGFQGVEVPCQQLLVSGEVIAPRFESNESDIGYQSYYFGDIWNVNEQLTVEAAAYFDRLENANAFEGTEWTVESFNPRLGLIVTPTSRDTLRLAAFRYILPFLSPRLDPTDIAGVQIFRNTQEGSQNTEYAASWEHQWGQTAFTALSLFHLDKSFAEIFVQDDQEIKRTLNGRVFGLELEYNQLLTNRMSILGSYRYLDVDNDIDPFQGPLSNVNRSEQLMRLGMRYVRPDGISASLNQTVRRINNDNIRSDETAATTDLAIAYQFSKRRGAAKLEFLNLFDNRFNWITDRFVLQGRAPERQVLFTLSFNL